MNTNITKLKQEASQPSGKAYFQIDTNSMKILKAKLASPEKIKNKNIYSGYFIL